MVPFRWGVWQFVGQPPPRQAESSNCQSSCGASQDETCFAGGGPFSLTFNFTGLSHADPNDTIQTAIKKATRGRDLMYPSIAHQEPPPIFVGRLDRFETLPNLVTSSQGNE